MDAGTMSPFEHGEVFVLKDGGEVCVQTEVIAAAGVFWKIFYWFVCDTYVQADLDLGNYERFLDISLTREHNITSGKVFNQVITSERRGDYLGATVQMVPHATDAIQDWIQRVAHESVDDVASPPDVCLIEVGGTVGDIESLIFLEALRQVRVM